VKRNTGAAARSAQRAKRKPAAKPAPQRPGLVTLSLGEEVAAMLRWLRRRHIIEDDGLPAMSSSEVVRDLVLQAYRRAQQRARD
jgi:hypothetical protein